MSLFSDNTEGHAKAVFIHLFSEASHLRSLQLVHMHCTRLIHVSPDDFLVITKYTPVVDAYGRIYRLLTIRPT